MTPASPLPHAFARRLRSMPADAFQKIAFLASAMLVAACVLWPAAARAGDAGDCRIGSYRLDDGSNVDIGASDAGRLRWRRFDGTTGALAKSAGDRWTSTLGWTGRSDGKTVRFDCKAGRIVFDGKPGRRIPLQVTDTTFEGAGVRLAGRLVLPPGDARVPIVVLVHGSEHDSARDLYALQRQLPAAGIGAFVYDKRGTGASGGAYTQNYLLLADDAIAAKNEALRLAGARAGRIGYQGGSQGGWVVPLAARIEPVDFAIVGFGLAVSPLQEDREAVALDLSRRGYGPDVVAKGEEIADAVAGIILADFRSGYDTLASVRAKYANEPWFKYVRGDITFFFLDTPEAGVRAQGPVLLAGVPANHDPMPVLRNLDVPQLWILAADDQEVRRDAVSAQLRRLLTE